MNELEEEHHPVKRIVKESSIKTIFSNLFLVILITVVMVQSVIIYKNGMMRKPTSMNKAKEEMLLEFDKRNLQLEQILDDIHEIQESLGVTKRKSNQCITHKKN